VKNNFESDLHTSIIIMIIITNMTTVIIIIITNMTTVIIIILIIITIILILNTMISIDGQRLEP